MGVTVRQKTKGKGNPWWVFIAENGRRTSMQVGDKGAAEEVASDLRAKLKLGQFDFEEKKKPVVHLFQDFAKKWIDVTVPATCKETTASDYDRILENHVLPVFKDRQIDSITTGDIKDFIKAKVTEGLAASTINHIKNVLSGILTEAVDAQIISTNSAINLGRKFMKKIGESIESRKVSNGDENEGKPDPLSQEELKLLLDTVQKNYPSHYPLFLFLARTGARVGEGLGLKWGDIDFNSRFINLRRSLSRGKITTLKSKRERQVDMSLQLAGVLQFHRTASKAKGLALGLGAEPEYVFTDTKGGFIDVHNWRHRVFHQVLKKAGLRKIRIHDLRHTYATLRISKGDNFDDVSKQLGHFSTKFTLDVYNHWMPGKKKAEVDALDDLEYREHMNVATV